MISLWGFLHDNGTLPARVSILGVPIDSLTQEEAVTRLVAFARSPEQHHVVTTNPEMLVEAARNKEFFGLLERSALNLPDGAGLVLSSKFLGTPLPERVTGVDLVQELAVANVGPIFFLGAAPGIAERAAEALKQSNPRLQIAGCFAGSPSASEASSIIGRINRSGARILLVAYGAPAQDRWIDRYLQKMPGVHLAIGVGGTFDFLAGTKSRAPHWMQQIGLEWLFRVFQEPSRFPRIFRAVITFPLLVLRYRSDSPLRGVVRSS